MLLRRWVAGALVTLTLAPAVGRADAPKRFQLRILDEGASAFAGDEIALTREKVKRLVIEILSPTAEEIETDKIYPKTLLSKTTGA